MLSSFEDVSMIVSPFIELSVFWEWGFNHLSGSQIVLEVLSEVHSPKHRIP